MMPDGTLSESASTAVCPAKRLVTRSTTTTGSDIGPETKGDGTWGKGGGLCGNAEKLSRFPDSRNQSVDVVDVVIDVERRPCGGPHSQATHQRLCAVMALPH